MAGEWRQQEWGEIATLEYGKSLRDYREESGRYRVFGTNGPIGWHDEPLCKHPGVIIGRKGAYRGIHYSPKPFFVIDTAFYLEPKQEMDLHWAYYCLLTYDINGMDSGSAIPSTSRESFYRLPVRVPPLKEQQAIACILGTLDDKIELNRRMNQTLEEMARAIFKSWFVDFDPVRAKAAVRREHPTWTDEQVSRAACPNLKPEIAALFPDAFEDSELGEIPKGWRVGTVQDLGEVICGKTPPTAERDNYGNDVPFVTIPDMHGKVFITKTEKQLSEKGALTQKGKFLPPFSICVSCIATPGLVALTSTQCQTNQQINSVIPSDSDTSIFCFFSLRGLGERIRTHGAGGSVLLNLNKGLFSSMKLLLPPQEAYTFQNVAKPILEKVLSNENEVETLARIRDTLLPKLISGELRVKDAEKIVGRCV